MYKNIFFFLKREGTVVTLLPQKNIYWLNRVDIMLKLLSQNGLRRVQFEKHTHARARVLIEIFIIRVLRYFIRTVFFVLYFYKLYAIR